MKLIEDLLGSDEVYVFGELLESKPIKELALSTDSSYHELLEIFAYGTWKRYRVRQEHLPKLNGKQTRKLKLLSIVDRASRSKIIQYSDLLEELEIQESQELEELIIDGIYNGLLKARLDQRYSRVEVESCMGRDVQLSVDNAANPDNGAWNGDVDMNQDDSHDPTARSPFANNNLAALRSHLVRWRDCTAKLMAQLDDQIEVIRQRDQEKVEVELAQSTMVETIVQSISSTLSPSNNSKTQSSRKGKEKEELSSDHQMDIDHHDLSTSTKTRKRTRK